MVIVRNGVRFAFDSAQERTSSVSPKLWHRQCSSRAGGYIVRGELESRRARVEGLARVANSRDGRKWGPKAA